MFGSRSNLSIYSDCSFSYSINRWFDDFLSIRAFSSQCLGEMLSDSFSRMWLGILESDFAIICISHQSLSRFARCSAPWGRASLTAHVMVLMFGLRPIVFYMCALD